MLEQVAAKNPAAAGVRARQSPFPERAKSLSMVDERRSIIAIAVQWVVIGLAIEAAERIGGPVLHWLAVGLAVVVIASRQQALAVLVHDAAHYRLFASRRVNDWVSDLFCGLPMGMVTSRYRQTHLAHHLEPLGPNDPDWAKMQLHPAEWSWPKTRRAQWVTWLRDMCGIGFLAYLRQWDAWSPMTNHFGRKAFPEPLSAEARFRIYLCYGVVTALVLGFGVWREFLLYWVLPLATVSQVMFRVRTISEHMGCGPGTGMAVTRNVEAGWLERLLISPMNVSHHLTHHLFPGVPWYNLPKLTRLLHDDAAFRADAFVSSSYLGRDGVVRKELTTPG